MSEHEGDFMSSTQIRKPVPAKNAFDSDSNVIDIGENYLEKQFRIGFDILVNMDFTFLIEDTDLHFPGMKIDTAIVLVLLTVKSHNLTSFG